MVLFNYFFEMPIIGMGLTCLLEVNELFMEIIRIFHFKELQDD